jgi:hypothetical protein
MYTSYDFRCKDCEFEEILLLDREEKESKHEAECPQCGGVMVRRVTANITKVSYIDGNGRFNEIREQRKIQRAWKDARRKKNLSDQIEIKKEAITRNIPTKGRDRKSVV